MSVIVGVHAGRKIVLASEEAERAINYRYEVNTSVQLAFLSFSLKPYVSSLLHIKVCGLIPLGILSFVL